MEAQKFNELAAKADKRWRHAHKLTIVYTLLAILGGSLWLAVAYYQARRFRNESEVRARQLDQKSQELDQKEVDLQVASANLARAQGALDEAKEAIKDLGQTSAAAKDIAQKSLKAIEARQISPRSQPNTVPIPKSSPSTPGSPKPPTPIPVPTRLSSFAYLVRPGDKINLDIARSGFRESKPFVAVVKEGRPLSEPYSFVVDRGTGRTIFVEIEFGFLADAPNDAKYGVAVIVNGSQLGSFEVSKNSNSGYSSLRFSVQ